MAFTTIFTLCTTQRETSKKSLDYFNFTPAHSLIAMAKELKDLTKRSVDYSRWYNELVVKADLAEQSDVRGCMIIKPYGYAICEKIQ